MQRQCTTDVHCDEGYSCQPCSYCIVEKTCQVAPCKKDADCGSPNVQCKDGLCVHIPCTDNGQCQGYCVQGWYWSTPGWCEDSSLPPPP